MRGTLRTVGTVALCVIIAVLLVGCGTGRVNDETSVGQALACGAAPAAGKSVAGDTMAPAAFDPARPISEPNELRSPSRPPIIHRPRANILPLYPEQVEDIKYIVRKRTQREIWFILVLDHAKNSRLPFYHYRVEAYAAPDRQSGRIWRGSAVYISEELTGPRIEPFSYAHVCETAETFPPDLVPPDDLTRFPFRVFGGISDEEIVEVVQFIRSGPSVPERLTYAPPGRLRPLFNPDRVLDPAAPIQVIRREGEVITVVMPGARPDMIMRYGCQKTDGSWTLVNTGEVLIQIPG